MITQCEVVGGDPLYLSSLCVNGYLYQPLMRSGW